MELKRLDKHSLDLKKLKPIYNSAFPKEERAPFRMLVKKIKRKGIDFFGLYDNDNCVGMAYNVFSDDLAYLFYLVIDDRERGKGYGTKAIKLLTDYYKDKKFFLALEQLDKSSDNYDERVKRHNFYRNAGLIEMPHHLKEATMIYDIMGTGGEVTNADYQKVIKGFANKLFVKIIDMRIIED